MTLPAGSRRLFSHLPEDGLTLTGHEAEVLEQLLESGDRSDLRWLTRLVSERQLTDWVRERGARRLSDRSRAFWSLLLDLPVESRSDSARDLWPL